MYDGSENHNSSPGSLKDKGGYVVYDMYYNAQKSINSETENEKKGRKNGENTASRG